MRPKIICIDFDGVIHSYTSGWQEVGVISDPPVPGAIEWLKELLTAYELDHESFKPVIYSSRSCSPIGIKAMQLWLFHNGLNMNHIQLLDFPKHKPPAWLTVDDRAIQFTGLFPSFGVIKKFKPWNR